MTDFILNTTAFPPLYSFKKSYQNINHHVSNHQPISSVNNSSFLFHSLAPPKYPSYLKLTNYSALVTEQYNHLQKKKRSRFVSDIEYNRDLEEVDFRLPQYWNKNDKSRLVEVGLNGLDVTYSSSAFTGQSTTSNYTQKPIESASIRSNFPTRPQCGIYYFEITIVSNGQDGLYALGFCTNSTKLNKLPGYEIGSFGYHGYNGMLYDHLHPKGIAYGDTFASGDIIGCGIDFSNETAFFTKNGVSLGCAFTITREEYYYPCVGLGSPLEKITANFGNDPFAFDITQYIKDQQKNLTQVIINTTQQQETTMDDLVLAYLSHQGYVEAAAALKRNMVYVNQTTTQVSLYKDDSKRIDIRRAVMSGRIDVAIEKTETAYPHLLDTHPDLLFKLKTRKFLETMIDTDNDEEDTQSISSLSFEEPPPVKASGRRLSWAAIAASPDTEKRRTTSSSSSSTVSFTSGRRKSHSSNTLVPEEDEKKLTMLRRAIEYGQKLQEEYQETPDYLDQLMDLFRLLSFSEPKTSPLAHLLDVGLRDAVASDLNNAIQEYEHHNAVSNLESLFKQSVATNKELSLSGHGKSCLIPVQDFYLCK